MKLTNEEIGKLKPNPIFEGLSDELKDVKIVPKIEKALSFPSDHKHRKVSAWQKCVRCQELDKRRKEKMLELGFKDSKQYYAWKQVMATLINKPERI